MPRVAKPALDAGEQRLGHAGKRLARARVRIDDDDHHAEKHRRDEQRTASAQPGGQRARERGPERARDVERHRAQRDGARDLDARDDVVDARLLRRQVDREAGADEKRGEEQRDRPDDAGDLGEPEAGRDGDQHEVRAENDAAAIDDVGERPGRKPEEERGRGARGLHQRHHQREGVSVAISHAATVDCIV